jgi:hypothetical protein
MLYISLWADVEPTTSVEIQDDYVIEKFDIYALQIRFDPVTYQNCIVTY